MARSGFSALLTLAVASATLAFVIREVGRSPRAFTPHLPGSEDNHGRNAEVPESIPTRGLRDVFWRVLHEVSEDRVTLIAGGVTFYLLLALFPALAALVSLYGLVADPVTISENLGKLAGMLPPGAFDLFADQIKSLAEKRDSSLGLTFFFGLAVALWSTHNGTLAIFDAMNIAYEEKRSGGWSNSTFLLSSSRSAA